MQKTNRAARSGEGGQALKALWTVFVGTCCKQGLGLEGKVLPAGLSPTFSEQGMERWPSVLPSCRAQGLGNSQ